MASGGKREGCGRRAMLPSSKRVQTTISVLPETKDAIRVLAKNRNIRIGRIVDDVVAKLMTDEEVGNL